MFNEIGQKYLSPFTPFSLYPGLQTGLPGKRWMHSGKKKPSARGKPI